MKKLVMLSLISLILSCKEKEQDGFKISGKIKQPIKDSYVVLEEFTDETLKKIDSAKVNEDGTYEIKGSIKESSFYRLNISNKQQVVLVLENKDIVVNADGTGPEAAFEVKGSKATDDFTNINKLVGEFQGQVQNLSAKAMVGEAIDTVALQGEYEQLRNKYAEQIKDSIRKIGPTVAAIFATNYLDKEADFKFFDSIATVFEKELPNSKYSKQLVESVKNLRKVSIGNLAPNISLANPQGETVSLESLRGKYVLIDFWASWCKPCRMENPNVVRMYNKFKDKEFEILGVSLDNDKSKWAQAINQDALTWKHVSDLKGWESSVVPIYNISSIPATYLIDKDGKIVAKNLRGKDLEKKLEEVLL